MKERPILFSGEMVQAILAGRKTVTRRLVKDQGEMVPSDRPIVLGTYPNGSPCWWAEWPHTYGPRRALDCPFGMAGDRLWVRETHAQAGTGRVFYRADDGAAPGPAGRWTPAIHMPRALSRIDLEVVSVRVERLHDITAEDVRAEGLELPVSPEGHPLLRVPSAYNLRKALAEWTIDDFWIAAFADLWEDLNGEGSWALNPWVWRIEFRRLP